MSFEVNQIISYWEMCEEEGKRQLQQGMNFGIGNGYSVVLMSIKPNAPYPDKISEDGLTIYYVGHDLPGDKAKSANQPMKYASGTLTQNGLFVKAIDDGQKTGRYPLVRVYEKLKMGIWNYRGLFEMVSYDYIEQHNRYIFEYTLNLTVQNFDKAQKHIQIDRLEVEHTGQIPGSIKLEVYKRDKGMCTKCGSTDNLHFDHILPYAKGGTSQRAENIQILCSRHNLEKSDKLDY